MSLISTPVKSYRSKRTCRGFAAIPVIRSCAHVLNFLVVLRTMSLLCSCHSGKIKMSLLIVVNGQRSSAIRASSRQRKQDLACALDSA